jgi:hypothetical protein
MKKEPVHSMTYLFMIRIWSEKLGEGQAEWRGRVQHVLTGERHYFRDWQDLIDYLLNMLPDDEAPPNP